MFAVDDLLFLKPIINFKAILNLLLNDRRYLAVQLRLHHNVKYSQTAARACTPPRSWQIIDNNEECGEWQWVDNDALLEWKLP